MAGAVPSQRAATVPAKAPGTARLSLSKHAFRSQVKDRNDGNLLLTRDGHILHIDFGYLNPQPSTLNP